jgi:uncharacterized membrane protein required for colicin V production
MSALIGLKRGLFKTLFGFLALILSIGVTYFASPYMTKAIIEYTEIDDRIEERIYKKIETDTQKSVAQSLKDAGVTKDLSKLTQEETKYILENDPDKETQVKQIDSLNLPDNIRSLFIENNNENMYNAIGVTGFYRYIARYTARLVVNVIALVGSFVLIRLVLFLISFIISRAMEEDPVLSGMDRLAGMVLGLGVGIVMVWVFMIIAGVAFGSEFDKMITGNEILQKVNDTNLLLKVITGAKFGQ